MRALIIFSSAFFFSLLLNQSLFAQVQRYRVPAGTYALRNGPQTIPAFCVDGTSRPAPKKDVELLSSSADLRIIHHYQNNETFLTLAEAREKGIAIARGNGTGDSFEIELLVTPKSGEVFELVAEEKRYAVIGQNSDDIASILKELPSPELTLPALRHFEKAVDALEQVEGIESLASFEFEGLKGLKGLKTKAQVGLKHRSPTYAAATADECFAVLHERILRGFNAERRLENLTWDLDRRLTLEEIETLRNAGVDIAATYPPEFDKEWSRKKSAVSAYKSVFDEEFTNTIDTVAKFFGSARTLEENWHERLRRSIAQQIGITFKDQRIPRALVELKLGKKISDKEAAELELSNSPMPHLAKCVSLSLTDDGFEFSSVGEKSEVRLEDLLEGKAKKVDLTGSDLVFDPFELGLGDPEFKALHKYLRQCGVLTYRTWDSLMRAESTQRVRLIVLAPRNSGAPEKVWNDFWGNQKSGVLEENLRILRERKEDCVFVESLEQLNEAVSGAKKDGCQLWFFRHNHDPLDDVAPNVEVMIAKVESLSQDSSMGTDWRCSSMADLTGEGTGTVRDLKTGLAAKAFIRAIEASQKKSEEAPSGRPPGGGPRDEFIRAYYELDRGNSMLVFILVNATTAFIVTGDDDDEKQSGNKSNKKDLDNPPRK